MIIYRNINPLTLPIQMKSLLTSLFLLLVIATSAWAQKYEPNTKWPYVYEDFTDATIYFDDNKKSTAKCNIHLVGSTLHYISAEGRVLENTDNRINRVEIGSDLYFPINGKLMQCTFIHGVNMVLKSLRPNLAALRQNGGAYGATTNSAATRELSSLEFAGVNQPEHGRMLQEKKDGVFIPVITEYFLCVDGKVIEADKKPVEQYIGSNRAADWKNFMKSGKIKWKNPDDLAKVLEFIIE